jgi:hypothetical protein
MQMTSRMQWFGVGCSISVLVGLVAGIAAGKSNYKRTDSRSQYVHRIPLYDAQDRPIKPTDPQPSPYSPRNTCKKCHDYQQIAHGYHFGGPSNDDGRPGEPWIWTDRRSGSQIPLSLHKWPGTYRPGDLGLTPVAFAEHFGGHLPGGNLGEPAANADASPAAGGDAGGAEKGSSPSRWDVTGELTIDCMLCHAASRQYSYDQWAKQVHRQNFAWAPTAALDLAKIVGVAKNLPDDFDPTANADRAIKTQYNLEEFDADGNVFFDITGRPSNNACYACHTNREVGPAATPAWLCDGDVHIRAGMLCVDCHRNGIEHHTVRGFEGEVHPTGLPIGTLSCRGCHMDEDEPGSEHADGVSTGGRLGAPKPRHAGLPAFHFDKLSCTACHSGPQPKSAAQAFQTSMAHDLGSASQTRSDDDPPGIVAPVFRRDATGMVYPYRMTWPAFWGYLSGDEIQPANPDQVYKQLRRTLRVRRDFRSEMAKVQISAEQRVEVLGAEAAAKPAAELSDDEQTKLDDLTAHEATKAFRAKLAKGLAELAKASPVAGAVPVYVSGGKVYRLNDSGKEVETFTHVAAEPLAWPLAHDVRPARYALGANGCTECHAAGATLFYGQVTPVGPAPDAAATAVAMYTLMGDDPTQLMAWEASFLGRDAFKLAAVLALCFMAVVGLRAAPKPRWPRLAWLLYSASIVCVLLLALSSFGALQFLGALTGWSLLAHVAIGGGLIFLLPLLALARSSLYGETQSTERLAAAIGIPPEIDGESPPRDQAAHYAFGLVLICGLLSAATMVLSMLPIIGTDAMEWLLVIHYYAGIALVVAILLHLALTALGKSRKQ